MPKIQFNHNKKISEYLKNKNGYDKRNHFIEITKIRNTRFTISWNEKYYQVIHIMRFFVFRNGNIPHKSYRFFYLKREYMAV